MIVIEFSMKKHAKVCSLKFFVVLHLLYGCVHMHVSITKNVAEAFEVIYIEIYLKPK